MPILGQAPGGTIKDKTLWSCRCLFVNLLLPDVLMEFNGKPIQHWPFYCEENIWHLCQKTFLLPFARKVVFISNENRCFAMRHQRAASLIAWDYHVVLLFYDNGWKVADLDSSMQLPCPIKEYLPHSFAPELYNYAPPLFRVVDADHYIQYFASDRRHMRDQNGTFLKPPPPLAPIKSKSGESFNLWNFVDVSNDEHGLLYDLEGMYTTFAIC